MTAFRELGDNDERNAGAIAEEINRLNVTRIIVSTTLIEGNEDCGVSPESWVGLDLIDDLLHEALKEIEFGRRRVTIVEAAGLNDGDWRQVAGVDVLVELSCISDVGFACSLG